MKSRYGSNPALALFLLGISILLIIHLVVTKSPNQFIHLRTIPGTPPQAVNYLDDVPRLHHPIVLYADLSAMRAMKGFLVEPNGLYVPAAFDCPMFNNNSIWGSFNYFTAVPSRWNACWYHYAEVKSGVAVHIPRLPVVDEEYFEHIAVWDTALNARGKMVMAELGARWGTWGSRAIAFLRKNNDIPYEVLLVEADSRHCKGAEEMARTNNMTMEVLCKRADPETFLTWAADKSHIDLLDGDIQGGERSLFQNEEVLAVVENKVRRLIIGTHSQPTHEELSQRFSHWVVQHSCRFSISIACTLHLRKRTNGGDIERDNLNVIFQQGCYYNSSYGRIAQFDGELILDNPKFYKGRKIFPE